MSLKKIYDIYKTMDRDNTMLCFKGVITSELLDSVLQIIESKLNHVEQSTKIKKKVYNVLVECLQNLYHHNENICEREGIDLLLSKSALLLISKKENFYEIKTGNYISTDSTADLRSKLENINSLDKDGLRALYKSILNEGEISDKGTAGLGMIDIARKSGNKLAYDFIGVDKKYDFFCLNIKIG